MLLLSTMVRPKLSKDGILLITQTLREIQPNEPPLILLVTKVFNGNECVVTDGSRRVNAFLHSPIDSRTTPVVIQLNEFVVSRENSRLYIGLVKWRVLSNGWASKRAPKPQWFSPSAPTRVHGGRIAQFVKNVAPYLSLETLSGNIDSDRLQRVSDFIQRHQAMKTIHESAETKNSHSETYMKALKLFQEAQMDRQKLCLSKNTGKQPSASAARKLQDQHAEAIQNALASAHQPLTPQMIQSWHKTMLQGILEEAGCWRTKGVKVGNVSFMPHGQVPKDVQEVCRFVHLFECKYASSIQSRITKAALVLFAIGDVHPWADGNGRTSRIAANWALGLPFLLHLFATPTQRAEIVEAIRVVRGNTALVARGGTPEDRVRALSTAQDHLKGSLKPLVDILLDRIARAVEEFQSVLRRQTELATQEEDVNQRKRFQQTAMESSCLICFESQCNIATLCCGKAVHLNCMAEWLSQGNGTCPQCRTSLPSLPQRLQRPTALPSDDDDLDDDETSDDLLPETGSDIYSTTELSDPHERMGEDTDEESTESIVMSDGPPNPPPAQWDHETTIIEVASEPDEDTTIEEDPEVPPDHETTSVFEPAAAVAAHAEETTEIDDDAVGAVDTEETTWNDSHQSAPKCHGQNCQNRAAQECANEFCGRCCLLIGHYACERHGIL